MDAYHPGDEKAPVPPSISSSEPSDAKALENIPTLVPPARVREIVAEMKEMMDKAHQPGMPACFLSYHQGNSFN